jgi:hypothetical protein
VPLTIPATVLKFADDVRGTLQSFKAHVQKVDSPAESKIVGWTINLKALTVEVLIVINVTKGV